MTLQEKFQQFTYYSECNDIMERQHQREDNANQCAFIAEEFAIEFAKWICEKAEIPHIEGKMNTTLEIFKKENGF